MQLPSPLSNTLLMPSGSLSVCETMLTDCYILPVYSLIHFLPSILFFSPLPLLHPCLCHYIAFLLIFFSSLCVDTFTCLLFPIIFLSPFSPLPPSFLSSGCLKFNWGSERLAFKPGGRRTRFLSTPCLALCVYSFIYFLFSFICTAYFKSNIQHAPVF